MYPTPEPSRVRRLAVGAALIGACLVVLIGGTASPASAGGGSRNAVYSWPSPTGVGPTPPGASMSYWYKTVVLTPDANDIGKTVSIEWTCGGNVVQQVSGTIQANAFNTGYPGVGFTYPASWSPQSYPPTNCTLTETIPTTVGLPNTPVFNLAGQPASSVLIFHA